MPTYEARCLNCGNLGHFREECPKVECENCHLLGHTAINCDRCPPAMKLEDTDINKDVDTSPAENEKRTTDECEFDDFLRMLSSPNAENETVEEDQSTSSGSSLDSFLNFLKTDTTFPENHSSTSAPEDTATSDDPASQSGKKEEG